jgi:hypothetical protein
MDLCVMGATGGSTGEAIARRLMLDVLASNAAVGPTNLAGPKWE